MIIAASCLAQSLSASYINLGRSILGILCFFIYEHSSAQYNVRHITTADGLIQGSIYYFLEDSRGYVWMTCQAGLNRYDGNRVKGFTHEDSDSTSIGKGEIRGLAESPDGDIWMGNELGISRYIRKTNKFQNYYLFNSDRKVILSHHQVFFANDSIVLYLNDTQGVGSLNYRTGKRQTLFEYTGFSFDPVTRPVHYDPNRQILWIRQAFGIVRYDIKSRAKRYFFSGDAEKDTMPRLTVYCIYSRDNQTIWLSTDGGLVELRGDDFTIHDIGINMASDFVYSMVQDKSGSLMLATPKSGLVIYSPKSRQIIHKLLHDSGNVHSLADNYLSEVSMDSKGVIWINVGLVGVDLLYPKGNSPLAEASDTRMVGNLAQIAVRGVERDHDGNFWIGTINDGVRVFSPNFQLLRMISKGTGLPHEAIRGIYCDRVGDVWICTKGGLAYQKRGTKNLVKITLKSQKPADANYIRGIVEIKTGTFVIATMAGLYRYTHGQDPILVADPEVAFTGSLYCDGTRLYAGRNEKDLICYKLAGDKLEQDFISLTGYNILSFQKNGADKIWVGTDNGLIDFDKKNRSVITTYSKSAGLPDNVVYSVLNDKNRDLWLTTNKGIVRFDSHRRIFQQIRSTAGIEFNSFASLSANGKLYFGSARGLYSIKPELLLSPSARSVRITELWINDKTFVDVESMKYILPNLEHDQNNIAMEVAALDYSGQVVPAYTYRLIIDGFSQEWVQNGSNQIIRLLNLSPASYKVQIRATDANGNSLSIPPLHFVIKPPFWQSWWFTTLLFASVLVVTITFAKVYITSQKEKERRLTKRIIEAQESERLRIARDLHDDVGNTLATAKGIINDIKDSVLIRAQFPELQNAHSLIGKAADDLRNVTHDLVPVDFSRFELYKTVAQLVEKASSSSQVKFNFIYDGQVRKFTAGNELIIYRIVAELINNVVKHSKATESYVQVLYQEMSLVVCVEDNGIGSHSISDNRSSGIGLKNVQSRLQFLNAEFNFDQNDNGTSVIIDIPYESLSPRKN